MYYISLFVAMLTVNIKGFTMSLCSMWRNQNINMATSQMLALPSSSCVSAISSLNTCFLFTRQEAIHRAAQKTLKGIFHTTWMLICFVSMIRNNYSSKHSHVHMEYVVTVMMPHLHVYVIIVMCILCGTQRYSVTYYNYHMHLHYLWMLKSVCIHYTLH